MENFRSMSCREGNMQLQRYTNNGGIGENQVYPSNMQDLRSFSTSHASCSSYYPPNPNNLKAKKNLESKSYKRSSSSATKGLGWSLSDPELQRKKRVASYKVYAVEGKMKGSFRKSCRWIKNTCSQVVNGFW